MTTFGELAKRISGWTSRVLVSGMILVAGLAFGRQVLQWWRADGPTAAPPRPLAVGPLGDPEQDHSLEFGGSDWGMVRGTASGDAAAVVRQIQARCAEAIGSCRLPQTPPGPAERDLLRRIASQPPVVEQPGQWRLYALDAGFPLVVGTREVGAGDNAPNDKVAKTTERVVTLGMATPSGDQSWITYTFHSISRKEGARRTDQRVPIPPESTRVMAVRAADGATVVAFKGLDPQNEWTRFFDSWLRTHGWETARGWVDRGMTRSLHGVRPQGGAWERIDVLVASDPSGEARGVVFLTPVAHEQP